MHRGGARHWEGVATMAVVTIVVGMAVTNNVGTGTIRAIPTSRLIGSYDSGCCDPLWCKIWQSTTKVCVLIACLLNHMPTFSLLMILPNCCVVVYK